MKIMYKIDPNIGEVLWHRKKMKLEKSSLTKINSVNGELSNILWNIITLAIFEPIYVILRKISEKKYLHF